MEVSHTVPQANGGASAHVQARARDRIPYSDAEIVDHLQRLGYGVSFLPVVALLIGGLIGAVWSLFRS